MQRFSLGLLILEGSKFWQLYVADLSQENVAYNILLHDNYNVTASVSLYSLRFLKTVIRIKDAVFTTGL